jgi:hypothetical protein
MVRRVEDEYARLSPQVILWRHHPGEVISVWSGIRRMG